MSRCAAHFILQLTARAQSSRRHLAHLYSGGSEQEVGRPGSVHCALTPFTVMAASRLKSWRRESRQYGHAVGVR